MLTTEDIDLHAGRRALDSARYHVEEAMPEGRPRRMALAYIAEADAALVQALDRLTPEFAETFKDRDTMTPWSLGFRKRLTDMAENHAANETQPRKDHRG